MTSIIQQGSVTHRTDGHGVATLTFEHPAHNSLPGRLLQELTDAIDTLGGRADVRVIVLRSGGDRTFCAGASFDELLAIEDLAEGKEFFSGFARVINAVRRCPKFVIARVQGKAVGGGVGLAAAADYTLATKYAQLKLSEIAIGIGPFVVGPAVQRRVGTSAFVQMSLQPKQWFLPAWALEKGLYQEVLPGTGELDDAVAELAAELAAYSPAAMQELKAVAWAGTEHWETLLDERAAVSGRLILTPESRAALAKIKPN